MNRYTPVMTALLLVFFAATCRNPISTEMNDQINDTQAPAILISSPADGSLYASVVEITGSISDYSDEAQTESGKVTSASYEVESTTESGDISLTGNSFSFTFSTENMSGSITVTITAVDWAGNSSEYQISLLDGEYGITGFTAETGDRKITLNWDEIPEVESYTLYYTDDNSYPNIAAGGTNGSEISSAFSGMTISEESNGIELTNGKKYIFQLKADFAADSKVSEPAFSDYINALPLSGFTLMPIATSDLDGEIEVFWSGISSDTGFYLYRSESEDSGYYLLTGELNGSSYTDTNVTVGTTYYYKIVPVTGSNIESNPAAGRVYGISINRHLASVREAVETTDILVDGDVLYMSSKYEPLSAWNISDIRNPVELYGPETDSQVLVGVLEKYETGTDSYLFRTIWEDKIDIFDINSDSPSYLDNTGYNFPQRACDITISGDYAYLCGYTGTSGFFKIYDIGSPSAIGDEYGTQYYSNNFRYCLSLHYDENAVTDKVYLGSYSLSDYVGSFGYVDISDPQNPYLNYDEHLKLDEYIDHIEVYNERAYLGGCGSGITIIDLDDGDDDSFDTLSKLFDYPINEGDVGSVAVFENYDGDIMLYASVQGSGLHEYTITANPDSVDDIVLNRIYTGPENGGRIYISDDKTKAYISRTYGGFNIVYIGDDFIDLENNCVSVDAAAGAETGRDIFVKDDYTFLATGDSLRIFDTSDPDDPRYLSSYDVNDPRGFTVAGDYLFLVDSDSGCLIIDISDPSLPELKSTYTPSDPITPFSSHYTNFGPAVAGDYLYIPEFDGGISVVNIADPENPVLESQITSRGTLVMEVAVDNNLLYAADVFYGLVIYDISDPGSPVLTGSYKTDVVPVGIDIEGDICCIANYDGILTILDISDPEKTELLSTMTIQEGASWYTNNTLYDVEIAYGLAFITASIGGITVVDISDPEKPIKETEYDPGNEWLRGIMLNKDRAFVAASSGDDVKLLNVFDINPVE